MYSYLRVQSKYGQREVIVFSSDSETLEWIFAQLQTVYPKVGRSQRKTKTGHIYGQTLRNLDKDDEGAAVWIIDLLGNRGWEPFAVDGEYVHLRRKKEP